MLIFPFLYLQEHHANNTANSTAFIAKTAADVLFMEKYKRVRRLAREIAMVRWNAHMGIFAKVEFFQSSGNFLGTLQKQKVKSMVRLEIGAIMVVICETERSKRTGMIIQSATNV